MGKPTFDPLYCEVTRRALAGGVVLHYGGSDEGTEP